MNLKSRHNNRANDVQAARGAQPSFPELIIAIYWQTSVNYNIYYNIILHVYKHEIGLLLNLRW
jgi:hypothetical protein